MDSIWRIRRSVTDRKLAGVCGGVAAHWRVDPVLIRVGWALLALTGGVGVVLYAAAWLLIPLGDADRSGVDDLFGGAAAGWPKEVWVTLVAIACIAAFALFGSVSPFGIAPAVVLAMVWYFGFYRNRSTTPRPGPPAAPFPADPPITAPPTVLYSGPATPFTEAATAWQRRVHEVRQTVPAGPTGSAVPPAPVPSAPVPPTAVRPAPAPASPPDHYRAFLAQPDPAGLYAAPVAAAATDSAPVAIRRGTSRSARQLRLVTLMLIGLTVSGLGLADYLGAAIPLTVYAAAPLAVLGLALVVATWLGRARGLLGLGVLLGLLALIGTTGLGSAAAGPDQYGSRQLSYADATALPVEPDQLGVGELTVDLSGLRSDRDLSYRARVDTGQLVVIVPPETGVELRYALQWGQVEAFGRELAVGHQLNHTQTLVPAAAGQPTLSLDLGVKRGQLEVRR